MDISRRDMFCKSVGMAACGSLGAFASDLSKAKTVGEEMGKTLATCQRQKQWEKRWGKHFSNYILSAR